MILIILGSRFYSNATTSGAYDRVALGDRNRKSTGCAALEKELNPRNPLKNDEDYYDNQ